MIIFFQLFCSSSKWLRSSHLLVDIIHSDYCRCICRTHCESTVFCVNFISGFCSWRNSPEPEHFSEFVVVALLVRRACRGRDRCAVCLVVVCSQYTCMDMYTCVRYDVYIYMYIYMYIYVCVSERVSASKQVYTCMHVYIY